MKTAPPQWIVEPGLDIVFDVTTTLPAPSVSVGQTAGMPPGRRPAQPESDTRRRILDATVRTIRSEGIAGSSTRAIARVGEFNQALIFYHFGSLNELLLAVLADVNGRRLERFRASLASVDTLPKLVELAAELEDSDRGDDSAVLAAIFASWPADDPLTERVFAELGKWNELVADAIGRALGDSPLAQVIPVADLTLIISAMFIGIEVIGRMSAGSGDTKHLFATLGMAAQMAEMVLRSGALSPAAAPVAPAKQRGPRARRTGG